MFEQKLLFLKNRKLERFSGLAGWNLCPLQDNHVFFLFHLDWRGAVDEKRRHPKEAIGPEVGKSWMKIVGENLG